MHFAEARRAAWRMVLRRNEGVGVGLCDCNECCEQRPSTGEHERNALEPLPPLSRAAAAAHLQMGGGSVGAQTDVYGLGRGADPRGAALSLVGLRVAKVDQVLEGGVSTRTVASVFTV